VPPVPSGHGPQNSMRIAEINDVASVATELARGLRARGHEADLIQPRLIGGGLPVLVKPVVSPLRALDWAGIVRRVRRDRYDLLHIHYAYLGVLGIAARRPYILHAHGADVWGLTPFTRWPTKQALERAAHVFYSTPDLEPHAKRYRPDAEFLPNPIDWRVFEPLAPAADSTAVYIACALDDLKGAPRILDACRILQARRPEIRITAVSGGERTAEFASLPNITFIPRQQRVDLPRVIARHGVVIGQVNLGAVGMAELEAMSCARPVVSHFVFNAAYPEPAPFAPASSPEEIAASVIRFADDPATRAAIGEAGRAWVRRYHDLDVIAGRVEEVALAALERRKAKR